MQEPVDELAFNHESGAAFFMAERQPSFPLPPEDPEVFG
ncbi:hypothetical protein CATRI_10640 [Corynebacterium atrinae]|nr:hypothetical protein CATRI_10640 [Corynebacterium atrinae]